MGLRAVTKPNREDVAQLFRLLLDRAPRTEQTVTDLLAATPTLESLVFKILESEEFQRKHNRVLAPATTVDTLRLATLIDELANRHPQRELYQPVFGVRVDHGGPFQRECVERCELVLQSLAGMPLHDMTVLDVGCNMGYVTFYLSERFAKASGVEYDELLFNFCVELNTVLKKNVSFARTDFFADYASLARSHDVCLLFSVIHYLVASKGIEEAKIILNDIVSCFDCTIIELSSLLDYPYMPADPTDLLGALTDVNVTLLGKSEKNQRPIYLIKKKTA